MSLHTIVGTGLGARLHLRRADAAATREPRPVEVAISLEGGSMRWLEATMACLAIATALLIGLGH